MGDPSLVASVFEEVLRYESPGQGFMRKITQDIDSDGVMLRKGGRALLMHGSANRDETQYPKADIFDFRRNPTDNLAFGYGMHHCAGQGLARTEGRAVLAAMIRHFATIETGTPKRQYNNAVRGLGSLWTSVTAAALH